MKLRSILVEWSSAKIAQWDDVSDHNDYDPADVAEQAFQIATKSGIYVSHIKDLSFFAYQPVSLNSEGTPKVKVMGAIWDSLRRSEPSPGSRESPDNNWVYDFDIAVDPECRDGLVGIHLINAALQFFRQIKSENPDAMIRVYVINSRLVKILERKYGFKIESEGRGTYMTFR